MELRNPPVFQWAVEAMIAAEIEEGLGQRW